MPTHVACVGDSITFGYGASSAATNYPSDLQKLLGPAVQVKNFGRNGATMLSNGSLPYIQQPEYAGATTFVANAGATAVVDVIIMLGTNDSAPTNWKGGSNATQLQTDYAAMIDHFQGLSTHPVVYVAPPPPAYSSAFGVSEMVIQDSIVPITSQVAAQKGAPIIDVNAALAGQPSLFGDGVHPNDMGYTKLAQVMDDGLLQPLQGGAGTGEGGAQAAGMGGSGGASGSSPTTGGQSGSTGGAGQVAGNTSSGAGNLSGAGGSVAGAGVGNLSGASGNVAGAGNGAGVGNVGGGGNSVESTPTGQSSGCALGTEGRGSRVPPGGCLAALALLILERRRRARLDRALYVVPDVTAAWQVDSGHCSNDFRKYARSDGDP
jgi:lysophospholipase L1-like esterase